MPRLAYPRQHRFMGDVPQPGCLTVFPSWLTGGLPAIRDFQGRFHDVTGSTTDGIQEAIDLLDTFATIASGFNRGTVYLCNGTYDTTTTITIAQNGVRLIGQGAQTTKIDYTGSGNAISVTHASSIENTILSNFELAGNDSGAKGIACNNLKDGLIEFVNLNGFTDHTIEGAGVNTLNVKIVKCRVTAGASADETKSSLSVREGNMWSAIETYFNTGGDTTTTANWRYETIINVRGHDMFKSISNIFDGAPTGIRSNGVTLSENDYWDVTSPAVAITDKCYVHDGNASLIILNPRGIDVDMVDVSAIDKTHLTFIANGRGHIGGVPISKVITPAQITADQNDYSPVGTDSIATPGLFAGVWRLSSDASRTITGIQSGPLNTRPDGQHIELLNVGAQPIVLGHQNGSSTAENRILSPTGADVTLAADGGAHIIYDLTTLRWRITSTW